MPYNVITPTELLERLVRGTHLVYDIETGPASIEVIRSFFREDKVKLIPHPGVFLPQEVKYGNIKDAQKKQEKLAQKQADHRQALANYARDCEVAKKEAFDQFKAEAALHATTGKVLAIGYGLVSTEGLSICLDVDEKDERNLLRRSWLLVQAVEKAGGKLISFNGTRFDYPFCVRRSWVYEDVIPLKIITKYRKPEDWYVDLLDIYRLGGGWNESVSLDDLCRMTGIKGKTPGMTGDLFHSVLRVDQAKAREYLANDIRMTYEVAVRMGVV